MWCRGVGQPFLRHLSLRPNGSPCNPLGPWSGECVITQRVDSLGRARAARAKGQRKAERATCMDCGWRVQAGSAATAVSHAPAWGPDCERTKAGSAETRVRGSKGCEFAMHVTASHAASRLSLCPASGAGGLPQRCPAKRGTCASLRFGARRVLLLRFAGWGPISQQTCAGFSKLRQPLVQDGKRIGPTLSVLQTAVLVREPRRRPVLGLPPPRSVANVFPTASSCMRAHGATSGGGTVRRAWLARGAAQSERSSHVQSREAG